MRHGRTRILLCVLALVALAACAGCTRPAADLPAATTRGPSAQVDATAPPIASAPTTFAVIGDYGTDDAHERAVAGMVASWDPAFIIAAGDDYYAQAGGTGAARYDESTGAYYARWLKDITTTGHRAPVGLAAVNAFFPALGNHDYSDAIPSAQTYLRYFTLPGGGFSNTSGNERYYDFVEGPVHFFVLNSNTAEPSGTSKTSAQAAWLKAQLAASTSTWNVVYDHHPPYSSDSKHGSSTYMRWPFARWGADVVISGHAHVYERVEHGGVTYFINGLGGAPRYKFRRTPVSGSARRYGANWGAQRVVATETALEFEFLSVGGRSVDRYRIPAPE